MPKSQYSYDPYLETVAETFLEDEPALQSKMKDLAQHIQDEIESWIRYENSVLESK